MPAVNIRLTNIDEVLADLNATPRQIKKALRSGLARTRRGLVGPRGVIARYVRDRYTVRARAVADVITSRIDNRNLNVKVTIQDGVIGLHNFGGRVLKRGNGVSFRVRKRSGRTKLANLFAFPGTRRPFFERGKGAARRMLFRKFGPAIASVVSSNSEGIGREAADLFERRTFERLRASLRGFAD